MGTWTVTAEGQEVLTISGQYFDALKSEDNEAAWAADARASEIAQSVLDRGASTESDLVTLALVARHFDLSDDRPRADEGRSAYQNGLMPHVLVDEVLRLAGVAPAESLATA